MSDPVHHALRQAKIRQCQG